MWRKLSASLRPEQREISIRALFRLVCYCSQLIRTKDVKISKEMTLAFAFAMAELFYVRVHGTYTVSHT